MTPLMMSRYRQGNRTITTPEYIYQEYRIVDKSKCSNFNIRCEECQHRISYPLCRESLTYTPKDNEIKD
jgi:hypothetical protein